MAAPILAVAAELGSSLARPAVAEAVVPSLPEAEEIVDFGGLLMLAGLPTANLITITVGTDGIARFALPRAEVGQGITTMAAQLIAEELDLPIDSIAVSLADSRPEQALNQMTGGSNTTRSTYTPIRTAAAIARERLKAAAAARWKVDVSTLATRDGRVIAPDGRTASYGSLATAAASRAVSPTAVQLKSPAQFGVIGRPQNRIDALAAVTGNKVYTLDLAVPDALPTMVRRPPTVNGTVVAVANAAAVRRMPGVTDVVSIPSGVAVRAATFGQCIDAVDALEVTWGPGTVDGESDDTLWVKLRAAEQPLPPPPPFTKAIDLRFRFAFRSNSALEPGAAIADVRPDRAEIWSCLKAPVVAQADIATATGLPFNKVTCHVVEGGGSFGRHLFADAAVEAARISKLLGKPVKLMWHRTDDFRHGRTHPIATSRVRATWNGRGVVSFDQRHVSVQTDFISGVVDALSATADRVPGKILNPINRTIYQLTQDTPYNFGAVSHDLNEILDMDSFHTGSMRSVYSSDSRTASELVVDQLAAATGSDPLLFRRAYLRDERLLAVLDKVAEVGRWGRPMPSRTAQGVALHTEYRSVAAALVEIDCRPGTVHRRIADGVSGPRVTRVVLAVDAGLPINPRGLEAQMQGGIMDGIAQVLTSSLHVQAGLPLEGSWDEYFYTRQWNVPLDIQVIVMPPTSDHPGGAGELGVSPAMAAVACAYARATGTVPTTFPINHHTLEFEPLPRSVIPVEPIDGLEHTF